MKRLRPRLFTLVSLISLCLCTLSIYVWRESSKHPTFAYPTTNAMRYTLLGSLPPLNLNDLSLAASLETTARYLPHVKYEIDWPALEAINVTQSMPVGTNLGQIRLGELLAKLTTPIGPKVRFTTHDDVIRISTIDTPLSTHGVQTIQSIPIDPFQDALAFHYQRLNSPPQPEIRPLYERTIGQRRLTFGAYHGYLEVCLSPRDPADIYCKSGPPIPTPVRLLISSHTAFSYQHIPWFDIRILVLPFWWLVAATAFFPLLWVVLFLRRLRRKQQHLCENCGYDLRATPTRCPECGHIAQHV